VSRAIWHDVECGAYTADLVLWERLAAEGGGPVLDVGAGTGRVTLHLARAGHRVTALDIDPQMLDVLEQRAAGLPVRTAVADAARFELDGPFGLVAVPMQTIQLLPDAAARAGFFASARRALAPGGLVALAIADALEEFEPGAELPFPDIAVVDGVTYSSQPTAVRTIPGGVRIERRRHTIAPDRPPAVEENVVTLTAVGAEQLELEAATAGLRPDSRRYVDPTPDHVASEVVVLRG
jgi:SAM-dependent methyltransferase